jgi:hypothetical protein
LSRRPLRPSAGKEPTGPKAGKRGIAGSMVFTVFNKDTLLELKQGKKYSTNMANAKLRDALNDYVENHNKEAEYVQNTEDWEDAQGGNSASDFTTREAFYVDEIPPFDVTITMQNEYGQAASFSLIGVEILNEGSGMSIDDITTERACTFVARSITPLRPITTDGTPSSK